MSLKTSAFTRRQVMRTGLGLGIAATMSPVRGKVIETEKSQHAINRFNSTVKILGTLANESVYTSFQGTLLGIIANQTPVVICGYQGLARTDWLTKSDGRISKRSFDIGFFSDPATGKPLKEVVNPMSGETVKPLHFQYGGAPAKIFTPEEVNEYQWSQVGDQVSLTQNGSGEFDHPMPIEAWPREASGDKLYYRSETNYLSTIQEISDPLLKRANYSLFWSSLLSWEPWLLMGQTPGFNMWRGVGTKLKSTDDIPLNMQAYLAKVQANYIDTEPPWPERIGSFDRFMSLRNPSKQT